MAQEAARVATRRSGTQGEHAVDPRVQFRPPDHCDEEDGGAQRMADESHFLLAGNPAHVFHGSRHIIVADFVPHEAIFTGQSVTNPATQKVKSR